MHGTHEVHKLSPENLTEFLLRGGYRAFDAYFLARLSPSFKLNNTINEARSVHI